MKSKQDKKAQRSHVSARLDFFFLILAIILCSVLVTIADDLSSSLLLTFMTVMAASVGTYKK